jgi:predicted nucleic acid-binding protein
MEESLRIRMTTAEKERLKELANEQGITISELILSSLKIKRKKHVKTRSEEIINLIHEAA